MVTVFSDAPFFDSQYSLWFRFFGSPYCENPAPEKQMTVFTSRETALLEEPREVQKLKDRFSPESQNLLQVPRKVSSKEPTDNSCGSIGLLQPITEST